jgi:hypothetical protein
MCPQMEKAESPPGPRLPITYTSLTDTLGDSLQYDVIWRVYLSSEMLLVVQFDEEAVDASLAWSGRRHSAIPRTRHRCCHGNLIGLRITR